MGNKNNEQNPPPLHLNVNNSGQPGQINNYYSNKTLDNSNPSKKNNNLINNTLTLTTQQSTFQKIADNSNNKTIEEEKKQKNKEINNLNEDKISIDIDIIDKNKVKVRIPVNKNKIWQKEFYNNQLIGEIIKDYINENSLSLPSDYFNELRCFKYKVSKEDKISTLLPIDEESEVNVFQPRNINKKSIDLSHLDEKYTEIMGKPFYNPFEILCFYKNERKFRILNYNNDIVKSKNINNFDITSAYCNGWNHLYISGGSNCSNQFLDINLKKNTIHNPMQIPPKKNHSMIFIPKHTVFIVGGNNLDTFYYNLKGKQLVTWGNLNEIRIEPALQVIKNKLYCIDSNLNYNNYSLEATDLTSNETKWNLIKPKISPVIINLQLKQELFGICKDKENVIFLGGEMNGMNQMNKNMNMNLLYNINNNIIEFSLVKFRSFKLKEKGFSPFNNMYDFILTDFPRESPQMAFYNKKKGKIELIKFSSDYILKNKQNLIENEKNQNINKKINFKNKLDNVSNVSPITFEDNSNRNPRFNNVNLNKELILLNAPGKQQNIINNINLNTNPNINSNLSKLINQNPKINNFNSIKNINKISPINYYKTYNNINNIHKNINTISNTNNLNNINYNNIKRQNPNYVNYTKSYINQPKYNYVYYNQVPIVNTINTIGLISKTPVKNYANLQYLYPTKKIVNYTPNNTSHSYDSTPKRYYYAKGKLNNINKRNNNIYRKFY